MVRLGFTAAAVGMRAPSLYSYFDSKHAIYDAMFGDSYRQLLELSRALAARGKGEDAAASGRWLAMLRDIALDLHCDDDALMHIYAGPKLWPEISDLAALLGAR